MTAWATGHGRSLRLAGGLGLLALLAVYDAIAPHLWNAGGVWWDVAWIVLVLIPAVFALVLIALPWYQERWVLPAGVALAALAAVLTIVHWDVPANLARLGACTLIGWWFLGYFETVAWVVLVAAIIPWVDAYSVWRGPTKQIVTNHEHVFTVLSFAFPVPGERAAANLGVPDLLFFALFLAAAARFGLRVYWTWIALVAALGLTIAATVYFDLSGLPALPGIALGFLVPNADLLYKRWRRPEPVSDAGGV
jgi:hypothetical protein